MIIPVEIGRKSNFICGRVIDIKPNSIIPRVIYDGNTVGWYDYQESSTITVDGSKRISKWEDRLGSGHDLLQATDARKPTLETDGVLFDGVAQYIKTNPFTYNQPECVYIVLQQVTWTSGDVLIDGNVGVTGWIRQVTASPNLSAAAGIASAESSNMPLGTFCIVRLRFNGASSKFQINETLSITGNFGSGNMGGITFGRYGDINIAHANIQIKEAIYRKVADAAMAEGQIYQYLKKKHGIITPPPEDLFFHTSPNDIYVEGV